MAERKIDNGIFTFWESTGNASYSILRFLRRNSISTSGRPQTKVVSHESFPHLKATSNHYDTHHSPCPDRDDRPTVETVVVVVVVVKVMALTRQRQHLPLVRVVVVVVLPVVADNNNNKNHLRHRRRPQQQQQQPKQQRHEYHLLVHIPRHLVYERGLLLQRRHAQHRHHYRRDEGRHHQGRGSSSIVQWEK